MSHSESLPAHPAAARPGLIDRLPLIGPLGRAIGKDVDLIFYLLVIAVTVLVLAIKLWGFAALVIAALAMVPLMFAFFIAISWP